MPQDEGEVDPAEAAANSQSFCPHCGGPVDLGGRTKVPPYQLSKFSPQDRGFGDLAAGALGAAGRVAGYISDASRAQAASE
jgi:hypothetical protein